MTFPSVLEKDYWTVSLLPLVGLLIVVRSNHAV